MLFILSKSIEPQILRTLPDPENRSDRLVLPDILFEVIGTAGGWSEIILRTGGLAGERGWVATAFIQEAPDLGQNIDELEFFGALEVACNLYGADRNYLFAVAVAESGVKNKQSNGSSKAFGPFQFTPGKWQDLVEEHGKVTETTNADRMNWRKQCVLAAISSVADITSAFTVLKRLPTGAELWMVHVLGSSGGAKFLAGASGVAVGPAQLVSASAIANNPSLFPKGENTTVEGVLRAAADKLRPGYARAAQLAIAFDPAPPGPSSKGTDPPWLTVAFAELAKRVVEIPGLPSNPEIEKYFIATDHPPARDDTPWCGAFVAWCIANSPDPTLKASVPSGSANAEKWLTWGRPVSGPERGAVAVMLLNGQDHVGFVTSWHDGRVVLLAGNQGGGKVCEAEAAGEVLGYRMFSF